MLRRPPAIAFDVASLKQAEQAGAMVVSVRDTETGTVYRATMDKIWKDGFVFNRGHGDQVALALVMWTATHN